MLDLFSAIGTNFVLAATGDSLADGIRGFVGPILMLVIGIVAITFLFRREMTQFMIFIVIAIVVAILFYAPDVIANLGRNINEETGLNGNWKK